MAKIRDLTDSEIALLRPQMQNEEMIRRRISRLDAQLAEQRDRLAEQEGATRQLLALFDRTATRVAEGAEGVLEIHDEDGSGA